MCSLICKTALLYSENLEFSFNTFWKFFIDITAFEVLITMAAVWCSVLQGHIVLQVRHSSGVRRFGTIQRYTTENCKIIE
jgi:hypothetical protein